MSIIKKFNEWVTTTNEWVSTTTMDDSAYQDTKNSNRERRDAINNIAISLNKYDLLRKYVGVPYRYNLDEDDFAWPKDNLINDEEEQMYGYFDLVEPLLLNWLDETIKMYAIYASYKLTCNGELQNSIVIEFRYVYDDEPDEDGDILSLEYNLENDIWVWGANSDEHELEPNEIDDEIFKSIIEAITVGLNPETQYKNFSNE